MSAKPSLDIGIEELVSPDGVSWAYRSPCFRAFNLTFGVRSDDPEVGPFLDHVLSGLQDAEEEPEVWYSIVSSDDGTDRPYALFLDSELVALAHSKPFVLRLLLWHINRAAVGSVGSLVVLHAGGVAFHGAGVIISGPSGSGKTTLTAALVRAGFGYLTDEAVGVDPATCLLHPYPKALAIRSGSWELLDALRPTPSELSPRVWHVAPTDIRTDAVIGPTPPSLIIFPTHDEDFDLVGPTGMREISRSEALMELFGQTFEGSAPPGRALRVLGALVERCRCVRLTTTDLPGAVRSVIDVMSGR